MGKLNIVHNAVKKLKPGKPRKPPFGLSSGSTLLNLACSGRTDYAFYPGRIYHLVGDSSSGKAQPLDAKVLTPSGFRKMGNIKKGDLVVDPDGGHAKVLGVFPQGRKKVYKVTTSNGTTTECCDDHLWHVTTGCQKVRKRPGRFVRSLKEIRTALSRESNSLKFFTPVCGVVEFSSGKELPFDPYSLGVFIGNGCLTVRVSFSSCENEIVDKVRNSLPEGHHLYECHSSTKAGKDWDVRNDCGKGHRNSVLDTFRGMGLFGCKSYAKFIPREYLRSSVSDRIKLLNGLMDTDGSVYGATVEYSTTSKKLTAQVCDLVRSLGGFCTVWNKPTPRFTYKGEYKVGRPCYVVNMKFQNGIEPFTLSRKKKGFAKAKSRRAMEPKITKVEYVGKKECQCISVDSKRNLYVTDNYIVTHNTFLSLTCMAEANIDENFSDYDLYYDDAENGAFFDFEKFFGPTLAGRVRGPRVGDDGLPAYSEYLEDFYDILDDLYKTGKPFIYVLDSMDVLWPREDERKYQAQKKVRRKNAEKGTDDKEGGSMGMAKAKRNSELLRVAAPKLRRSGSILIIVSQAKTAMEQYGDGKTNAGGLSLKFYSSLQMWTSVGGHMKKAVNGRDREMGIKAVIKVKGKNRQTGKERRVQVPIYHSVGIDDTGSMVEYLVEEGWWKKGTGGINAKELGYKGNAESLVQQIEANEDVPELKTIVKECWEDVESKCVVERKRRYDQ